MPANEDLRVFCVVALKSSFVAAAQELGSSTAYVSKRLRILEQQLGAQLLHRTTRRVALTEDGERACRWAQRILDDLDQLRQEMGGSRVEARGALRVCSSFGFGRQHVAPALGALSDRHPRLRLRCGRYLPCWRRAAWCRCCRAGFSQPTSGRSIRCGWNTRPNCVPPWNS